MPASSEKLGLWLVGACGSVAATVILGLSALKRGLAGADGLVTACPEFDRSDLPDFKRFVVGGHEIRRTTVRDTLQELHSRARLFDADLLKRCGPDLLAAQRNVRRGTLSGAPPKIRRMAASRRTSKELKPAETIRRLARDIRSFCRRHRVSHCVVVNLSSTEPPFRVPASHKTWAGLSEALKKRGAGVLPPSSLYALAAAQAGAAFIDFTPSCGITHPGVRNLADQRGVAYMGRDGKTGETLLKSALAPMFSARNLRILSWSGYNILGARDGQVLDDDRHKESKVRTKDRVISGVCGYKPESRVSIDLVESLHDRKTAWDFIHFRGFLDTHMSVQFTWQGSDSALAAPLVIDLARLAVRYVREGGTGCMTHLACFFKDPMGTREQDFHRQMDALMDHVTGRRTSRGRSRP